MPPREGAEQSPVLQKERSVLGSMHPSTSLNLETTPNHSSILYSVNRGTEVQMGQGSLKVTVMVSVAVVTMTGYRITWKRSLWAHL